MIKKVYVCFTGNFGYTGNTPDEAYEKFLMSDDDHDMITPDKMTWIEGFEIEAKISATMKPIIVSVPDSTPKRKYTRRK